ncbi:sulfur oxidation c-type cytochrome SoxA [Bradyrhizobium yuanmingense]|uniref:L-cysteine S-thiosulfotransferase subunit SoxA n=2 Tax=Nitrobacteraceae TaxID=41294 RepID=A0ABV4GG56_9BRAD
MNARIHIPLASLVAALVALALTSPDVVAADKVDPVADARAFQNFFFQKFPNVKHEDFVNGPYSMNEDMKRQWQEKEEFPPYEFALEAGKEMFSTPFKNGKTYADCFPNGGIGIRQNYPYFDSGEGKVITLELALNRCREANGEAPYSYIKDEMASLTAYMAYTSRGKLMDIKIPDDPRALAAYENGKRYFYTRRGQMNFSCASCHVQSPGERIRAETLAPALGILNAMPIYRSEWSGMGTTSRRFVTCNSQTRAVPLEPQADEYRDVEYFPVLRRQRPADLGTGSTAMKLSLGLAMLLALSLAPSARAASEADYKAAYAAAEAASKEAAGMRNQWTVTVSALAAAKRAADGGDFGRAVAAAREAEALAKASIFQAVSEKEAWKAMEIR